MTVPTTCTGTCQRERVIYFILLEMNVMLERKEVSERVHTPRTIPVGKITPKAKPMRII